MPNVWFFTQSTTPSPPLPPPLHASRTTPRWGHANYPLMPMPSAYYIALLNHHASYTNIHPIINQLTKHIVFHERIEETEAPIISWIITRDRSSVRTPRSKTAYNSTHSQIIISFHSISPLSMQAWKTWQRVTIIHYNTITITGFELLVIEITHTRSSMIFRKFHLVLT